MCIDKLHKSYAHNHDSMDSLAAEDVMAYYLLVLENNQF